MKCMTLNQENVDKIIQISILLAIVSCIVSIFQFEKSFAPQHIRQMLSFARGQRRESQANRRERERAHHRHQNVSLLDLF